MSTAFKWGIYALSAFLYGIVQADTLTGIEFKADYYTRDLSTNSIKGKGNAWLKKESREIWADEIEVDLGRNRASANGNVHIKEADLDIWARHIDYNLKGEDGTLEDATLIIGSIVLTGETVKKIDSKHLEIENGTYSNCNVEFYKSPELKQCQFDWKLAGKYFWITFGEYVHVKDVLVYTKGLPVFYTPYFISPIKTQRQSGLLPVVFSSSDSLGSGVTLPFFWAFSAWQDITFSPTWYSKTGLKLGTNYRYFYSPQTRGEVNIFLLQRRFSDNTANPATPDPNPYRYLNLAGEWAIDLKNRISLGAKSHSSQRIRLARNPYYTFDYLDDFPAQYTLPALRSQVAFSFPADQWLATARIEHEQSLIISKDKGVDRGSVTQAPTLTLSSANTKIWERLLSYEVDFRMSNYYRSGLGYDSVSSTLDPNAAIHNDPIPDFHAGDYIRTGRRLNIEPRLIANVPLAPGFMLQPVLKTGTSIYHFEIPKSEVIHREYMGFEVPFSLYLTRNFNTSIEGYKRISHVLQPRVVYAKNLYQSQGGDNHPFFYSDDLRKLSNPRFDLLDLYTPYEYMRFELINRIHRFSESGPERFFLFQLSEQFNSITSSTDPRFNRRVGPIELLSEVKIGRFYGQVQGNYQLETSGANHVRENDISSTLTYANQEGDSLSLSNRITINAEEAMTEKTIVVGFYKHLPLFFDLQGNFEYSYQRGDLRGANLSVLLGNKPPSCWGINLSFGQNDLKQKYAKLFFRIDFGAPGSVLKSKI